MTAPVDVRAVLRRHADLADQVACDAGRAEAHEVYAAVAELIEAGIASLNWESGDGRLERQRLRAALSRSTGGV